MIQGGAGKELQQDSPSFSLSLSLCVLHTHESLMEQTDAFKLPQATTNMY